MLNERGMIPKDKGWGMSNLGLWGKNPCVATLFVLPPFLFHQPLQWLGFVVGGQLWLVVEAVIAFGSGVAGLSVPCPRAHSTHDCIHSPLFHDSSLPTFWDLHDYGLSVIFLAGSDCLPTRRYSSVWGTHSELRAVLLHPRLSVKGHSRFWLSHKLIGLFSLL